MVKRAKKKTKKAVKRPTSRKKTTRKTKTRRKKTVKKSARTKNSHWATYQSLETQVDRAWTKLQADVKRKASPKTIIEDKNHLMLLLGECNYMARECARLAAKQKKRK